MLKDVTWSEDGTYKPKGVHTPIEFFSRGLENSYIFDLELGYFNSAAINVLSDSFATFISHGGMLRMVINQIVSEKDKEAITKGLDNNVSQAFDLSDLEALKETLNEYDLHFFNCLAYLIQEKRIILRIIKPRDSEGLSHTKKGRFTDGELIVSFTGSANFTIGGFINNREDIQISFSDSPDMTVRERVDNQRKEFNVLIDGKADDVEYLDASELEVAISSTFGHQDIDELVDVERKLKHLKMTKYQLPSSESDVVSEDIAELEPHFPYPSGPREYQQTALDNWKANGKRGFFAMATGTGKTITSLNCLYDEYKNTGSYKAIILVPTIALVDQWHKECMKFNFNKVVKISSKSKWKDYLSDIITTCLFDEDGQSYVILTTYASFIKQNVYNRLFELPLDTLVIADEAHNMGSPSILQIMPQIPFMKRIGLSATPDRKYDDDGNRAINAFFGINDSYTFEYTMKEAIDKDVLCHYRYFPHVVHLTEDEMMEYKELSAKIAKFFDPETKRLKDNPMLTALMLKRKRIIHKAQNKLALFKSILNDIYSERDTLQYTMVYVPEGVSNYDEEFVFATESDYDEDTYSESLIDKYTSIVSDVSSTMTVEQFTSMESDRNGILRRFASGSTQVLTAMKCLDEGVDVPRAEYAIFCASTGNPRQFIQRRGRILRNHSMKTIAYIYDMVVVPQIDRESTSYELERSLLKRELERVYDFASLATNKSYTNKILDNILDYYKLNIYGDEN